jgi:hypothetical protein
MIFGKQELADRYQENPALPCLGDGEAVGCTYARRKYLTEGYTFR